MLVREARAEDVPAIVGLLADDDIGRTRESPTDLALYRDAFDRMAAEPHNRILVAEEEGRIVGTFQLTLVTGLGHRGGRRATLESVHVAPDRRSEGVGTAMMEWAIDEARRAGCRMVQLTTDKRRTGAHRFYARLGFTATHEGMKLPLDG